MNPILTAIYNAGLLPTARLTNAQQTASLAQALHQAGLTALSLDAHAPNLPEILAKASTMPLHIGLHNVEGTEQARQAIQNGAAFIVLSGCHPEAVQWGAEKNVPVLPVCKTEEEITQAQQAAAQAVCVPQAKLADWTEKFPQVSFIAWEDVTTADLPTNAAIRNVLANALPLPAETEKDTAACGVYVRQAIQHMLGFDLRHVGINCPDENASNQTAGIFEQFFGFPKTDRGGAYFAGEVIEVMKKPFYGTHGHIAISTYAPERAAYYLQQAGAKFNWDSAGYNPDGALRVVYLQDEIGGFAVHILKK